MSDNVIDRVYAGQIPALDQTSEEVLSSVNEAMKERWLAIFIQLTQSSKFKDFVNNHFDIHDIIDDTAKSIETRVIEKPFEIKYQLTPKQLISLRNVLAENKVKKVPKVMEELLAVLHHDHSSLILSSDDVVNLEKKLIT